MASASITKRAASASSGSSRVIVTSARPMGGRFTVPLKMQSLMRPARRDLWLCSPRTQLMASTTLDLPQPLGPTMHVVPVPLNVTTVRSQNDLKPVISTFRSFNKVSPLTLTDGAANRRQGLAQSSRRPEPAGLHTLRAKRDDLLFPNGGTSSRDALAVERKGKSANAANSLTRHTFGRFSVRGPAAWRMRWRYGRKM